MRLLIAIVFLVLGGLVGARAGDIEQVRVHFDPGTTGATLHGRIKGYRTVDYLLGASAGQRIAIRLKTSNRSNYFNLLFGDDPSAIHVGSISGNSYKGVLPKSGDYRIRVYLMRNAARRGETASYTLSVAIHGKPTGANVDPAVGPDYADGLAGGPDFYRVAHVPANDVLNVRAGPGTGNAIVGALGNGDRVRNLGCRIVDGSRWCRILMGGDQSFRGWVNGRYLVE